RIANSQSSWTTSEPGERESWRRPRSIGLSPSCPPGRMVIATLAKVPSGMTSDGRSGSASLKSNMGCPRGSGLIGKTRPVDLGDDGAEVGGLGQVEAAGAVLGRQAPGVARPTHDASLPARDRVMAPGACGTLVRVEERKGEDLVDDAGELARGAPAFHLWLKTLAAEIINHPFEDADEDHRLAGRVLEVLEHTDRLAGEQAIGAAGVGLAGAVGESLRA